MRNPFSLQGRKALVTGANTGLGQAIAVGLAAAGADVVCAARRAPDETLAIIARDGGKASALSIDFADPLAAKDSFAGAGFDILVNNAGIIRRADSVEFSELDWDEVMDVNLKALFFTTLCKGAAGERPPRQGRQYRLAPVVPRGYSCAVLYGCKTWRRRSHQASGK
jgi:2-deoxy-D-gluconate 3-dehydrogenase